MEKALLIYNPRAGRWRTPKLVHSIRAVLSERYSLTALGTERPGHATSLARQAVESGVDAVFSFGGDGTLRETAIGLLGSPVPLGPLPGGTVNILTRSLRLPSSPVAAAKALLWARDHEMDVGLCGENPFLMMASAGIDAQALGRVNPALKRLLGTGAVAWAGLEQWATYRFPKIEILADERPRTATFVAVCNVPQYGGLWHLAPAASPSDGRLDLVLFTGHGRLATLGFARDFALGRHVERPDVELFQVEEVELLGPGEPALQLDGDAVEVNYPVTIRLSPHRLRILTPARESEAQDEPRRRYHPE